MHLRMMFFLSSKMFEICDIDDVLYDISLFVCLFESMSEISEWMINAYKALFIFNLFLIVFLIIDDVSFVWWSE